MFINVNNEVNNEYGWISQVSGFMGRVLLSEWSCMCMVDERLLEKTCLRGFSAFLSAEKAILAACLSLPLISLRKSGMIGLILSALLCLELSACSSYDQSHFSEEMIAAPSPSLADELAVLPTGVQRFFDVTPFGPATIEAGSFYLSGLGEQCRAASVLRGVERQRLALCKQSDGAWRLLPSIFESLPQ